MPETERENRPRVRKPKGRRVNKAPILAAIAFILIVLLIAVISTIVRKYTPTKERANLQEYYNVSGADDMAVVLDQQLLEEKAKFWDGHVYLDYQAVRQYLNQRFYWESNENILRYTTDTDVISVNAGYSHWTPNKNAD